MRPLLLLAVLLVGCSNITPDAILWREDKNMKREKVGSFTTLVGESCELRLEDGSVLRAQKFPMERCFQEVFQLYVEKAPRADYGWGASLTSKPTGSFMSLSIN